MTLKILKKGKQGLTFCLLIVYLYLHPAFCLLNIIFKLTTQHRRDINYYILFISAWFSNQALNADIYGK